MKSNLEIIIKTIILPFYLFVILISIPFFIFSEVGRKTISNWIKNRTKIFVILAFIILALVFIAYQILVSTKFEYITRSCHKIIKLEEVKIEGGEIREIPKKFDDDLYIGKYLVRLEDNSLTFVNEDELLEGKVCR